MSTLELSGIEFQSLTRQILQSGHGVRFQARGQSMQPFIRDGDILEVKPLTAASVQRGDVVLIEAGEGRVLAHRVIKTSRGREESTFQSKGDACSDPDGWFQLECILGRVTALQRGSQRIDLTSPVQRVQAWIWVEAAPLAARFAWLPRPVLPLVKRFLLGGLIPD